jgi:hypothetical protein
MKVKTTLLIARHFVVHHFILLPVNYSMSIVMALQNSHSRVDNRKAGRLDVVNVVGRKLAPAI